MAHSPDTRVNEFGAQLSKALADNLTAFVLYGSAARGQYVEGLSDLNTLLVVRDASPGALRPAEPAINVWSRKEPPPLIFSEAEWRASADVFPLEIEDMRASHRVIAGRDPLDGLVTTRDNLRYQVEREVRSKLLHLRTDYAAAAADGKALGALLQNSVNTFFVLFRAILRLAGQAPPADTAELIRHVGDLAGFDPAGLEWADQRRRGSKMRELMPFDTLAERYVTAVERVAAWVNDVGGNAQQSATAVTR